LVKFLRFYFSLNFENIRIIKNVLILMIKYVINTEKAENIFNVKKVNVFRGVNLYHKNLKSSVQVE